MADEDERRFYLGDEVRVRKGCGHPEMRPEVAAAVAVIGDVADRRGGQTVTVMYRDLRFFGSNLPARAFELVRRNVDAHPDAPSARWPKLSRVLKD